MAYLFKLGKNEQYKTIRNKQHYQAGARRARNYHSHDYHPVHNVCHNFIRQLHHSSDIANGINNKAHGIRSKLTLPGNDYTSANIRSKTDNLKSYKSEKDHMRSKSDLDLKETDVELDSTKKQVRSKPGLEIRRTDFDLDSAKKQLRSRLNLDFRRNFFKFDNAEKQVRSIQDAPVRPTNSQLDYVTKVDSSLEDNSPQICFSSRSILIIIVGASLFVIALVVTFAVTCSWIILTRFWEKKKQDKKNFAADKWWSRPSSSGLLGFFSKRKGTEMDEESSICDANSMGQNSRYTLDM